MQRANSGGVLTIIAIAILVNSTCASAQQSQSDFKKAAGCTKPLYFTFDTGHMEVAPLIAQILKRHSVQVTFFAANETTKEGDGSLGTHWASWWKARASEGHEFASHTYDHAYWRGDLPDTALATAPTTSEKPIEKPAEKPLFRIRPSAGTSKGRELMWDAKTYCENIQQAAQRLQEITGQPTLPLFRAPGGKTSPKLLAIAKACGWAHVGWSPAGFLGDELSSDKFSNPILLNSALKNIRTGDILLAHLGIWSRKEVWASAVLEPLIVGLKGKGFCFETLRQHPAYQGWIATHNEH